MISSTSIRPPTLRRKFRRYPLVLFKGRRSAQTNDFQMDAEKRAQAPESGAFNAAAGRRTRPNFAGMGSTICKRVSFFNFRVQLVRRIPSRKYLPILDRLAVIYGMPVNFYQHPNVMARIFAGSIRTAMHLIMITAKAFSQCILISG